MSNSPPTQKPKRVESIAASGYTLRDCAGPNGEVEGPDDHARQGPRAHTFSRVPRPQTDDASRPPPTIVRRPSSSRSSNHDFPEAREHDEAGEAENPQQHKHSDAAYPEGMGQCDRN